MKKTSFIALVTLSSLVLSQAAVFADEGSVPVDSTASVVVTPTHPSSTPSKTNPTPTIPPVDNTATPNVTPPNSDTSTSTAPTTPSTTEPSKDDAVLPKDSSSTVKPSTDKQDTTPSPSKDTTQKPSSQPSQTDTASAGTTATDNKTVTVPTVDGGKTTLTPSVDVPTNKPNVSAQTAVDAGASQVGTTSQVTGQIVQNVTPAAPVYTNTGYQIVSTVNSQVVVAYAYGSRATVSPEEVGGTVNADKTISVTDQAGEKKTLPHTGEKAGVLMMTLGLGILALVVAVLFKRETLKR
ncbi:LPXTG cell wall anchor domain protein [Streptococcus anginosus SK1138]|uniref:LPXTG cell wall anchor domain protein n=1 Tax=Streptococcus anginosus SK1138 TaxID=1161422 RepID=A0AAD2Y9S7_STRAP|nr:LPXTG cell wall anchor domain-containing protein [Streptococcus anginosus]EJP24467.1 LPXTG cell wall anchor domain protein [Streptococcus anginosus SK1138]